MVSSTCRLAKVKLDLAHKYAELVKAARSRPKRQQFKSKALRYSRQATGSVEVRRLDPRQQGGWRCCRLRDFFLSYSWDSETDKNWVTRLAHDLRRNGVDGLT